MLVKFWREQLLPLWRKTNYFPKQEYFSSFYCTEDGRSVSLLNLGTGLPNNNVSQLRTCCGVLSPLQEPEISHVLGRSQNCEVRLLVTSCLSARVFARPSVRVSAWNNSALTGRIFMKFVIWVFFENLSRKFKFRYNTTMKTESLHEYHYALYHISINYHS